MQQLEKKILIGFGVAIFVLVLVVVLSVQSASRFRQNAALVAHTHKVIHLLEQLFSSLNEAESIRRAYVIHQSSSLEEHYAKVSREVPLRIQQLRLETADNPVQQTNLVMLQPIISSKVGDLERSFQLWTEKGRESMPEQLAITERGIGLAHQIGSIISRMQQEETRLLELRNARLSHSQWMTQAIILISSALTLAAILAAGFLIRRDITARGKAERQMEATNAELKAFAYTVSHDLKAPLRGISGYAQELERKHAQQLSERARFCIAQIITATRNLDLLIEDLLEYSKIGGESQSLSEVPVQLMIDRLLRTYQELIAKRGVNISVNLPFATVTAWERGLQQALSNVIDNAIKYSQKAENPKVEIAGLQDRTHWIISVKDNGIGFNMDYHDKIFGLFNRLVRPDQFEGTGAGLAIARKLLEKQGGLIYAQSAPGEGSTFYIKIPKPL